MLLVPAFTSVEALRKALLRRPEWSDLSVLVVNGKELMDNVDPAVTIVINPLTRLEYEVRAREADPEVKRVADSDSALANRKR